VKKRQKGVKFLVGPIDKMYYGSSVAYEYIPVCIYQSHVILALNESPFPKLNTFFLLPFVIKFQSSICIEKRDETHPDTIEHNNDTNRCSVLYGRGQVKSMCLRIDWKP